MELDTALVHGCRFAPKLPAKKTTKKTKKKLDYLSALSRKIPGRAQQIDALLSYLSPVRLLAVLAAPTWRGPC
jgi:hypothetical protein